MRLSLPTVERTARWWNRWPALAPIIVAVAVRSLLEPVLNDKSPFLLFTVAVMVSSIYGGLGIGIAGTSIGMAAGIYFLANSLSPAHTGLDFSHGLQILLYLAVCAGIIYFIEALRETRHAAERIAREQARLAQELAQANTAKDQFLAMVSHELRSPLTAIVGWANLLRAGDLMLPQQRKAIETIQRNARVQEQLISDLLDVSRIVSGKLRLDKRTVDPGTVVDHAVDTARPAALAKCVQLLQHGVALGPLCGDSERLQQVLWNLLSNAIKFTPGGGRVEVRISETDSQVQISVIDNGPGIPSDFLPYAFERFRQGTTRAGGLGLGLAITKQLVEMHGGTIRARNVEAGTGAAFDVVLPRDRHLGEEPTGVGRRRILERVRVLVVDDDPNERQTITALLRTYGAQVLAAGSAGEAVDLVQTDRPDVVLTDIGMPGEDGFDLLRRIRSLAPELAAMPAAALTERGGADDRRRTREAGFDRHITTPVDPEELASAVADLALRE